MGLIIWLLMLFLCGGCFSGSNRPPPQWRSDKQFLERKLPFLAPVEACRWRIGVFDDREGGLVPGPSSHRLTGYATLTQDQVDRLLKDFRWSSPEQCSFDIGLDGKLLAGVAYKSNAPVKQVPSGASGAFYLFSSEGVIYFDVVID